MFPIRLAVVGSRTFRDEALLKRTLDDFIAEHGVPSVIVSGGALGVDTLAEQYAGNHGIPTLILRPEWGVHGKRAGILRNAEIVRESTHMVAFCVDQSRGTMDSVQRAKKKGIYVHVVELSL